MSKKAKENRIKRINDQARPLPKGFIDWMDKNMPVFILYESGKKTGQCTHCGRESEFKSLRYNKEITCPKCRKKGTAKTIKRIQKTISRKFVYLQNIKNGVLCRFIEREWNFDPESGEIAKVCCETLRAAVEQGRRQYWYEQRGYGWQWLENNVKWSVKTRNSPVARVAGRGGWSWRYENIGDPKVYKGNYQSIIKKSLLRYFPDGAKELISQVHEKERYTCRTSAFLDVYDQIHRHPGLEAIWKSELKHLVPDYIIVNKIRLKDNEKELHKILGLKKELFKKIRKEKPDQEYINACQILQDLTNDINLIRKTANEQGWRNVKFYFEKHHMPIQKTEKYLKKLRGTNWQEYTYQDYLDMAQKAGSDMTDEFVLFPRNLKVAHDAMVATMKELKEKETMERAKKKDKSVKRVFEKIKKDFSYQDDVFLLRPAQSNTEIVLEGQKMHHCVGYSSYAGKMIKGESFILFLRKTENPDEPFYTIEITPDYRIIQRHGKYNKEGEEVKEVDAFLDRFRREKGHVTFNHAG